MENEKQTIQPNEPRNAPAEALVDLPIAEAPAEATKGGGETIAPRSEIPWQVSLHR